METLRVVFQSPILLILRVPRVYSQRFGFCTFILPELRVVRGSILQVLPVLVVIREDTARL